MNLTTSVLATVFVLATTSPVLAQVNGSLNNNYNCSSSGSLSYCYGSDGSAFTTIRGQSGAYTYGNDSTGQQFQCNTTGQYSSCQ